MKEKLCKHCGLVKPASAFSPQKDRPCGLSGWCKECRAQKNQTYRKQHPHEPKQPTTNGLLCNVCGTELIGQQKNVCPDDECRKEWARRYDRELHAERKPMKERRCKECSKLFISEYGDKRRTFCSDKCSAKHGKRISKAVRRTRLRGADDNRIERVDPLFICERDGWRCYLCGIKTPRRLRGTCEPNAPEVDHVVPVARGGSHTEDNLKCCCRRCNHEKSDRMLGELSVTVTIQQRLI